MSLPARVHDVVVVGGRVAGSLTALGLAEQGASVLVLESRHFPSDTLSTHFFRGDGLGRALQDVGVLDEVLATGAPKLTCEYSYADGTSTPEIGPPQEPGSLGFCLSVRRRTLDAILAAKATSRAGVTFQTDCKVVELITRGGTVVGVRDAKGTEHAASAVVGADGRRSTVARQVNAADRERWPAARAIYYRYVSGWTAPDGGRPDGAEFSLLGNELAYAFPSDGQATCIALSVALEFYATGVLQAERFFESRMREHSGLWPRMLSAQPLGGLFVGAPSDSVIRAAAGPGWALVGDAGTHQDPWSGVGMDTAARQAAALAECLATGSAAWLAAYPEARDGVTLERFGETVAAAPDLRTLLD